MGRFPPSVLGLLVRVDNVPEYRRRGCRYMEYEEACRVREIDVVINSKKELDTFSANLVFDKSPSSRAIKGRKLVRDLPHYNLEKHGFF